MICRTLGYLLNFGPSEMQMRQLELARSCRGLWRPLRPYLASPARPDFSLLCYDSDQFSQLAASGSGEPLHQPTLSTVSLSDSRETQLTTLIGRFRRPDLKDEVDLISRLTSLSINACVDVVEEVAGRLQEIPRTITGRTLGPRRQNQSSQKTARSARDFLAETWSLIALELY